MALKIVVATSNPNKIKEIGEITKDLDVEFVMPDTDFNPIETGETFEENSKIKALCAMKCEKRGYKLFLADDSGLCVDYLNGAPGIKSARYAETPQKRIEKLLNELKNADNRCAHFTCVLTLVNEKGEILNTSRGICNGKITTKMSGKNGFGYDPVFAVDGYNGLTMADLDEDEKNKISHRGLAFFDMINFIKTI